MPHIYGIMYSVKKNLRGVLCIAVVLSLCPLLFGMNYFSIVGALITLSLIAELLLMYFTIKKRSEEHTSELQSPV